MGFVHRSAECITACSGAGLVLVWLSIRALLTFAFEGGPNFPDMLVGSVGGEAAVGIAMYGH
jgi:hypothetical protein